MHTERLQYDREQVITQAYYTAAWQRAKKMPNLHDVLRKMKPKEKAKPMTPEQMLAVAKQKHAMLERRK